MKRFKWRLGSVSLEIVLVLMQEGARFVWNIPYDQKSIWMHPIELLDDVCHLESRFGLFGDIVSFGAR